MRKEKFLNIFSVALIALIILTIITLICVAIPKKSAVPQQQSAPVTTTQKEVRIDPNDDLLILVNYNNPIPDDYKPDLVQTQYFNQKIDKRAAQPLKQMVEDCLKAGHESLPCSGYRSKEEQVQILEEKVQEYQNIGYSRADAEKEARKWITEPGKSEHHTGLAMDIIDMDYQILDEKQEKTATQQWLMKHCWEYGFILRYPADKKDITHIDSESWHYRYVGKEHAKRMHDSGLCLEDYVEKYK